MDIAQLQADIDTANQSIANSNATITAAQAQIATEQATLVTLNAQLAQAELVNSLEALTTAEIATVNGLLSADGAANTTGVFLSTPGTAAAEEPAGTDTAPEAPPISETPAEPTSEGPDITGTPA